MTARQKAIILLFCFTAIVTAIATAISADRVGIGINVMRTYNYNIVYTINYNTYLFMRYYCT